MASKASRYQILQMERVGTPPLMDNGVALIYDDPEEAAQMARAYARQMGTKLCVKPLVDGKWRDREQGRMYDGTYRRLPWDLRGARWWLSDTAHAIWKDHYPHASLEKPGWIAYTKSEEDGEKDKQTLLRPGAYLNRYFEKVLNDYGVGERGRVEEFMAMYGPVDIKFAETEADILKVYDYGPQTCMNGKRWPKNINPVSIYAAGDLQVAYIGDLEKGKVSARSLVWPAKKLHSRIYGDVARLTQGLNRLGYKWGAPIGAKLKRIPYNKVKFDGHNMPTGCFIAPYIDKRNQQGGGHLGVIDKGDHLVICMDNELGMHHAGNADGTTGPYVPREDEYPTFECGCCGKEGLREVYQVYTAEPDDGDDGEPETWCRICVDRNSWYCRWTERYYGPEVKSVEVDDGHLWAKYYADMYAEKCDGNGKLYRKDYMKTVHFGGGVKKRLSPAYIAGHLGRIFTSQITNHLYPISQRAYAYNNWGSLACAKEERQRHTFQCDACEKHWLLEYRNQPDGDDKLFCPECLFREAKRRA